MDENQKYSLDVVRIRQVKERELYSETPVNTPERAVQLVAELLSDYDRELFCIVNLQADLRPINLNIVSLGALNMASVHPREVMKSAILSNAASIMMFHSHPSGNLTPSKEDIALTDRMIQVCELMQIPVMDHIIVGNDREYYSFHANCSFPLPGNHYASDVSELHFQGQKAKAGEQSIQKELQDKRKSAGRSKRAKAVESAEISGKKSAARGKKGGDISL